MRRLVVLLSSLPIFAVSSLRPLEQPFAIVFHFTAAQSKAGVQFWKFINGTRKRILVECCDVGETHWVKRT